MVSRKRNIEALIRKARSTLANVKAEYEKSLREKSINEDFKVDIKNIFENLRSCLDYLARDINVATGSSNATKLYFPIRPSQADFASTVKRDFPNLLSSNPALYDFLEKIQPYHDPWLGQFNKLNNENKHQDLVEQVRHETKRITASNPTGGVVSWDPAAVKFGPGVRIHGVPIDPRTQLPAPNQSIQTTTTIWVDFKFRNPDLSVLPFLELSIEKVEFIFEGISRKLVTTSTATSKT